MKAVDLHIVLFHDTLLDHCLENSGRHAGALKQRLTHYGMGSARVLAHGVDQCQQQRLLPGCRPYGCKRFGLGHRWSKPQALHLFSGVALYKFFRDYQHAACDEPVDGRCGAAPVYFFLNVLC